MCAQVLRMALLVLALFFLSFSSFATWLAGLVCLLFKVADKISLSLWFVLLDARLCTLFHVIMIRKKLIKIHRMYWSTGCQLHSFKRISQFLVSGQILFFFFLLQFVQLCLRCTALSAYLNPLSYSKRKFIQRCTKRRVRLFF